jgi:hypothetical protein
MAAKGTGHGYGWKLVPLFCAPAGRASRAGIRQQDTQFQPVRVLTRPQLFEVKASDRPPFAVYRAHELQPVPRDRAPLLPEVPAADGDSPRARRAVPADHARHAPRRSQGIRPPRAADRVASGRLGDPEPNRAKALLGLPRTRRVTDRLRIDLNPRQSATERHLRIGEEGHRVRPSGCSENRLRRPGRAVAGDCGIGNVPIRNLRADIRPIGINRRGNIEHHEIGTSRSCASGRCEPNSHPGEVVVERLGA